MLRKARSPWPLLLAGCLLLCLGPAAQSQSPSSETTLLSSDPVATANDASALWQAGWQAYQEADYATAINHWSQALAGYQQQGDRQGELATLEGLGIASYALSDYPTAIAYHQAQLQVAQALGDRAGEARSRANLGNIYQRLGDFGQALALQQAALALWQETGDVANQGKILTNIGNVYLALGNDDRALWYHEQGYDRARQLNDPTSIMLALYGLGAIQAQRAEYAAAQDTYLQSRAIAQQLARTEIVAQLELNLGAVAGLAQQVESTLTWYDQGLELATTLEQPRLAALAFSGRASIHLAAAHYDLALRDQEQSWAQLQTLNEPALEVISLKNWAEIFWQSGQFAAAEQKLRETLHRLDDLRENLADADQVSIFDTQQTTYSLLQQVLIAQDQPAAALEIAEQGRAQAFAARLANRLPTLPPLTRGAATATEPAPGTDRTADFDGDFDIEQMRAIARSQQATLVEYSLIPDDRAFTLGRQLGDYIALFIWVVQPSGTVTFRQVDLRSPALDIPQLVRQGRQALGVRGRSITVGAVEPGSESVTAAERDRRLTALHQLLIDPIADLLPRDPTHRVILIPHQELFLVPFAALPDAHGQRLIERHTLLSAPSIQVLALTAQLQAARPQTPLTPADWLIVGNPVMPTVPTATGDRVELAPLPGAEQEAREIAQLFDLEPLLGAAATETAVVARMPQARIIHLATHGLLDYGQPQDFGVRDLPGAIALTPTATHDGLLTAAELTDLTLVADLVVLSACNTGRGKITGDGVIGLSRSLMTAGVPSVVVSLWSVPDAPTAWLMTEFYRQLQQDGDRAQALRQAMLSTQRQFPDPVDWAGFTLLGDPGTGPVAAPRPD